MSDITEEILAALREREAGIQRELDSLQERGQKKFTQLMELQVVIQTITSIIDTRNNAVDDVVMEQIKRSL